MRIMTRNFGEIDIAEDKIIVFENGIIGFPELTRFTLLYDEEQGVNAGIRWMQSLQEPAFALPVMDPLLVMPAYNPEVDEEVLKDLGELNRENQFVLVTVSVPSDLTKMTANLQGPIIINADTRKAAQIIVDGKDYKVKFPIYEILKARKAGE